MSSRSSSVSHTSSHPSEDSVQLPAGEHDLLPSQAPEGSPQFEVDQTSGENEGAQGNYNEELTNLQNNDAPEDGDAEERMVKDNTSSGSPSSGSHHPGMVSLFIGLGPNARQVNGEELRRLLETNAIDAGNILDVRHRGRCAFADINSKEEADHLIEKLDGVFLDSNVRLTVQTSLNRKDEQPSSSRREREVMRREEGRQTLFIGLGPHGGNITNEQLQDRLAAVVPYVTVSRRRDMCAFVDVESREDALKLIEQLNNIHLGDARLSVQLSRERKRRRDPSPSRHAHRTGNSPYYQNDRRRDDFSGGGGRRFRRNSPSQLEDRRGGGPLGGSGASRSHGYRRGRSRSPSSRSRSLSDGDHHHSRRRRYSDDNRLYRRRTSERQRDTGDRRRAVEDRHRHRHHRRMSSSRSFSSRSYSSRSSRSSGGSAERRRRDDRRGGERRAGGMPPPLRR